MNFNRFILFLIVWYVSGLLLTIALRIITKEPMRLGYYLSGIISGPLMIISIIEEIPVSSKISQFFNKKF